MCLPDFAGAITLALPLVRTDTPADSRKIAAAAYNLYGVAEISFRELRYPVGNIIAYRATLLAPGNLAPETPLRLSYSLRQSVILRNLFELLHTSA